METNFFTAIAALHKGKWIINIDVRDADMLASIMVRDDKGKDAAMKHIVPLALRGTPASFDRHFFDDISSQVRETSEWYTSLSTYQKQKADAKKNTEQAKDIATKAKTIPIKTESKYEMAMKKVDELAGEGKHRDAWMKCPQPNDFPEQAAVIRKRRTELAEKFAPEIFK